MLFFHFNLKNCQKLRNFKTLTTALAPPRPCLALSCCREKNWEIDMICPVPDGSRPAAIQVRHGPVAATRVAVAGIILGVQGPRGSSRGAGARDLGTGSRRQGRGLVVRAGAVASIHHSC